MIQPAQALWARSMLRRHVRATIFLTLFAALAASASMTAWQYSRRADTVVDRRVERFHPADGALNTCPPGADPSVDLTPCFAAESNQIAYRTLAESVHVSAARIAMGTMVEVSAAAEGEALSMFSSAAVSSTGAMGVPNVVEGRPYDDREVDEVLISESVACRAGLSVGSTVWVGVCGPDAQDNLSCGDRMPLEVVGVIRTDRDLVPDRAAAPGAEASTDDDFGVFTTSEWHAVHGSKAPSYSQTVFRLAPGATLDDVRADMQRRLAPGWTVLVALTEDVTTYDGLRDSTRLQARSLLAIAVILMIASLVFVGQALVRQIRREMADHPVAAALGMTASEIARVAIVRAIAIAVGAAAIAMVVTAIASAFGPPGLAGRAEVRPGFRLDALVLAMGGAATLLFVIAVTAAYARLMQRAPRPRVTRVPLVVVWGAFDTNGPSRSGLGQVHGIRTSRQQPARRSVRHGRRGRWRDHRCCAGRQPARGRARTDQLRRLVAVLDVRLHR